MAEDIRDTDTEDVDEARKTEGLVLECRRQAENCEYTSTSLYIWQKWARLLRNIFVVAPIILGGFASSQILTNFDASLARVSAAMLSLLAGFFPAIYEALGMDMQVTEIGRFAAEFTNLRDRFRQAANISKHGTYGEFKAEFEQLMDRMDSARSESPPVPEWCFKRAQKKIGSGHYRHETDAHSKSALFLSIFG